MVCCLSNYVKPTLSWPEASKYITTTEFVLLHSTFLHVVVVKLSYYASYAEHLFVAFKDSYQTNVCVRQDINDKLHDFHAREGLSLAVYVCAG